MTNHAAGAARRVTTTPTVPEPQTWRPLPPVRADCPQLTNADLQATGQQRPRCPSRSRSLTEESPRDRPGPLWLATSGSARGVKTSLERIRQKYDDIGRDPHDPQSSYTLDHSRTAIAAHHGSTPHATTRLSTAAAPKRHAGPAATVIVIRRCRFSARITRPERLRDHRAAKNVYPLLPSSLPTPAPQPQATPPPPPRQLDAYRWRTGCPPNTD
jgi:hypothetical protein